MDVARNRLLRDGRQQDVGLAEGDEDEGAAIVAAARAGAGAAGERQHRGGAREQAPAHHAAGMEIEAAEGAPTDAMNAAYTSGRHCWRSVWIWASAVSCDMAGR